MLKRMSVVICGLAVIGMTAGYASAQTATQEAKDKTKAAADKTGQAAKEAAEDVTDASITAAVKTKLLADTKVGGLKIDVDTKDHIVTLSGPVHTVAERNEAVRLARTTTGVKRVVNKLVVQAVATTGRTDKDDKLKAEAKETAATVKDATKTGAEKTGDAAKKVGEKTKDVAQDVAGKTKDAAVKTKDVTADASITAAVKTKLLADTKVGGLKIDVDTKDNVVTLTGRVKSAAERDEAVRLATNTTGVKRVVNNLTIVP